MGQLDTLPVVHQVGATTLVLSVKEAEEVVRSKIEASRASREVYKRQKTPRTPPTVKVFSNRRDTIDLELSDVILEASKEAVMFETDRDTILASAVARLNMDTYIRSTDSLKGIVAAICAMFAHINRRSP